MPQKVKGAEAKFLDLEGAEEKIKEAVLDKRVHLALLEFKRATAIVSLKEIEDST